MRSFNSEPLNIGHRRAIAQLHPCAGVASLDPTRGSLSLPNLNPSVSGHETAEEVACDRLRPKCPVKRNPKAGMVFTFTVNIIPAYERQGTQVSDQPSG